MISSYVPEGLTGNFWAPGKGVELAERFKTTIVLLSLFYVPIVLLGQRYMSLREPFSIKRFVFIWNILLAILSFVGSIIILYNDLNIFSHVFHDEKLYTPGTRAVIALFTLTKALEFGDTIILVLKKKPIVFLHLFHHLTVTLYCWHAQYININFGHYFAFINLCIHSLMYSYYALCTFYPGNYILKICRPYITLSQTLQMLLGITLSYIALSSNTLTPIQIINAKYSIAMYFSYAILFSKFYIENYTKSTRPIFSLYMITIHLLATAGVFILIKHNYSLRIIKEVVIGYSLTAFIFIVCIPLQCFKQNWQKTDNKIKVLNNLSRSSLYFFGRNILLILNCFTAWLEDYFSSFLIRGYKSFQKQNYQSQSTDKSNISNFPFNYKADTSTHPYLNYSISSPVLTGSKKTKLTKLKTLDSNIDENIFFFPNKSSSKLSTHTTLNSIIVSLLKIDQSSLVSNYFIGIEDICFLAVCYMVPTIYTMNMYDDFFLGLCVHGALRWILELYTAKLAFILLYKPLIADKNQSKLTK